MERFSDEGRKTKIKALVITLPAYCLALADHQGRGQCSEPSKFEAVDARGGKHMRISHDCLGFASDWIKKCDNLRERTYAKSRANIDSQVKTEDDQFLD